LAVAATVVGLLATGAALPSAAEPVEDRSTPGAATHGHSPKARLWMSVVNGEDPDGADRSWAVLVCGPDGGTHPRARAACHALREAGGDVHALPAAAERMCAKIYSPVVVEVMGRWRGRLVEYRETFPNRCLMESDTGQVFAFDED
jgi:hypothetical protein